MSTPPYDNPPNFDLPETAREEGLNADLDPTNLRLPERADAFYMSNKKQTPARIHKEVWADSRMPVIAAADNERYNLFVL